MPDDVLGQITDPSGNSITWGNDDSGAYVEVNWTAPPPPQTDVDPPLRWNPPPPPYRIHPDKPPKPARITGADPDRGWAVSDWEGDLNTKIEFKVLDSCRIVVTVWRVSGDRRYPIRTTIVSGATPDTRRKKASLRNAVNDLIGKLVRRARRPTFKRGSAETGSASVIDDFEPIYFAGGPESHPEPPRQTLARQDQSTQSDERRG